MSTIKEESNWTLVQSLEDGDLSTLALSGTDPYSSSDFESLENIQMETECITSEEVIATEETEILNSENNEPDTLMIDSSMTDISEDIKETEQIIFTTANQTNSNLVFQTKPTLQKISMPQTQSKTNVTNSQTQSIMIVSPSGGGASQILKISHPPNTSADQLQSIAQSLISTKSADSNIVQIRPSQNNKSNMNVKTSANPNVYSKMIVTGGQSGQQVLLASSEAQKSIKNSNSLVNSPTKVITFEQAQQMGLIQSNKMQHILPATAQKTTGIIVNKISQSSGGQTGKLAIVQNNPVKSPAKILPAPVSQIKTMSNSQNKTIMNQNSQKVIIRQSSLKSGTLSGGSQIIRIPANQNISSQQVHQLQIPGSRQVQYVRLVSNPSSVGGSVTAGKVKNSTLQTVGVTQKINNQQQMIKVVPINSGTGNQTLRAVAPKTAIPRSGQRLIIPATSKGGALAIPASALSQLASGQAVLSTTNMNNIVVLPAQYVTQQQEEEKVKSESSTSTLINTSQNLHNSSMNVSLESKLQRTSSSFNNADTNGIRTRKPCNCTKSQCLKLYCDCFANGEFCHMCNCNNCSNNLGNEEERQRAIKSCLERNPNAFRPKIGKARETGEDIRRHNKGCNCKRSGCLKNYCECYEAKIPCSENCKCIGCRNVEESALPKNSLNDLANAVDTVRSSQLVLNKSRVQQFSESAFRPPAVSNAGPRQPFNFLTDKVVEMTCQCLMAQAEEAERNMLDDEMSQKLIIEEFGRCLKEIIESAHKAETT